MDTLALVDNPAPAREARRQAASVASDEIAALQAWLRKDGIDFVVSLKKLVAIRSELADDLVEALSAADEASVKLRVNLAEMGWPV